ncbi:MAG: hypothetical protein AAGA27_05425 [Pseudomonadota bacterium]
MKYHSKNSQATNRLNEAIEILFKKRDGIDKLLPAAADNYQDCAMLQVCTAIMFFFSFSQKLSAEKIGFYYNG